MRIGVDACCWSNRRGFGRFTRELLETLVALDQDNQYLFFVDQDTAVTGTFPDRVKTVVAPTLVSPTEAASASGRRSLRDLWALSRKVMQEDLDLFFFPAVYSYFPILNRTKIIVTIHDMIADNHPAAVFPNKKLKFFWKSKQYLAVRQAHLILTVSEYSKQQIVEYFHLPDARVQAISEGPSKVFAPLPRNQQMAQILCRYDLGNGQRFLLYVGGISPHKNLKVLIEAFHQLHQEAEFADVKLVLVGDYKNDSFHSDYPSLKHQIEQLHLEGKAIFTGFVADHELAYLYNAAALLVLPSLDEGFGLPVIEAMACGTPVICSDRGSLPEILGDAGRFFDPYQPQPLLNLIKEVLSDKSLQSEMRESGLTRSQHFTWEAAARKTAHIFTDLVDNRANRP
jgi:glycosyltransferase involved in cell wall biosynthesis